MGGVFHQDMTVTEASDSQPLEYGAIGCMALRGDTAAPNPTYRLSGASTGKICDMRAGPRNTFSFQSFRPFLRSFFALVSSSVLSCLFLVMFAFSATSLQAQEAGKAPSGVAWGVRGQWQIEGRDAPILTGDAIQPGSLLLASDGAEHPSITVLLPDGQRFLYECFTAEDCARGFRVPSLYRQPDPFGVEMLARIRAVLAGNHDGSKGSSVRQESRLPRDEVVAVLGSGNRVQIAGLAARLPNGRYTYDLRPLHSAYPRQSHLALEKKAPTITLPLPSPGLYALTIVDDLNTPRIDLLVAAVRPAQAASVEKSFHHTTALMGEWNGDYFGWPLHDFQEAYLESLMLGVKPLSTTNVASNPAEGRAGRHESEMHKSKGAVTPVKGSPPGQGTGGQSQARSHATTAEPTFSPRPGVFDGDTAVTLRCETPGAILHYTIDGSQPVASSPVYNAPIMVKATELTVKSFASVAGKKDSAVVTGIFRIRE